MHALDARTVNPDLEHRPRRRQIRHLRRVQLDGQIRLVPGVAPSHSSALPCTLTHALVVVGPKGGLDDAEEAPDDPVVVEAGDIFQGAGNRIYDLCLGSGTSTVVGGVGTCHSGWVGRVEPRLEERDQLCRNRDVRDQRGLDVRLAEGRPGLTQILGHRPQDHDLAPGQLTTQDQGIETVALGPPLPHS